MHADYLPTPTLVAGQASFGAVSRVDLGRRHLLLAAAACAAAPGAAVAQSPTAALPAEAEQALGAAPRLQGSARLRMFGLLIYDARLWVAPGFEPLRFAAQALALELTYARSLKGGSIAERSLEEMRRGGVIAETDGQRWLAFMNKAFPDVKNGDRLCGLWSPAEGRSSFFLNGGPGQSLVDRSFGQRFFGIWLAEHSSQPEMRLALLGRSTS